MTLDSVGGGGGGTQLGANATGKRDRQGLAGNIPAPTCAKSNLNGSHDMLDIVGPSLCEYGRTQRAVRWVAYARH